ncbi:MAG TPA: PorV/PorQ family protein [Bacteroidota bacterium]|nr:PorV/PorQ family protein [Bacteroidota bacterium]
MKKKILLSLIMVVGAGAVFGQSKTGTSVGQFLLIEPSARIAGMGNAGATIYNEIQAAYYNPAAIGHFQGSGVQFTHSPWIADITYDFAGVAVGLGEVGNLYASVTSLNSGEIDVRTVEQPLGTGERYTVSDIAVGLGYGRQISDRFSVGVQVTYLTETIWHSSMSAFSLNVGTLYRISEDGLHIGASISNFGTRAKFDGRDLRIQYDQNPNVYGDNGSLPGELFTESYTLPILFRVGIGIPLKVGEDNRIQLVVDAFHPSDNTESMSLGAEWMFQNAVAVRAGYQNLFQQDSETGLTLGAGLQHQMDDYRLNFDYGWADHGRLEQTHRLTLGVTF